MSIAKAEDLNVDQIYQGGGSNGGGGSGGQQQEGHRRRWKELFGFNQ